MGFAAIGMLFSGAATGLSMYSQMQQGATAERVAKYNNRLAQIEANNLQSETAEGIKRERINNRAGMATLKARMSATGLRTDTGAPLVLAGESAARLELGIADAARASAMQASSLRQKGVMGLWEGKMAKQASTLGALGTGIQGATALVSSFGHNKYTGAIS